MLQRPGLMFPPHQNAFPVHFIFLFLIAIVLLFVVCLACHSRCSEHLLQEYTSQRSLCSAEYLLLSWMQGKAIVAALLAWSHVFIISFL